MFEMLTTDGVLSWNSLTDCSSAASSSPASPTGVCMRWLPSALNTGF